MALTKLPNESDPVAIRQAIQRLNKKLDENAVPTWAAISVTGGASFASTITAGAISAGAGSFTSVDVSNGVTIGSMMVVGVGGTSGAVDVSGSVYCFKFATFQSANIGGALAAASNLRVALSATIQSLTITSAVNALGSVHTEYGLSTDSTFQCLGSANFYKTLTCNTAINASSGVITRGWAVESNLDVNNNAVIQRLLVGGITS